MSSKHNKPHLPFEQQLALLKKRGLEITDDLLRISYLSRWLLQTKSLFATPARINPSILHRNLAQLQTAPRKRESLKMLSRIVG
jgi:hypothetical protein